MCVQQCLSQHYEQEQKLGSKPLSGSEIAVFLSIPPQEREFSFVYVYVSLSEKRDTTQTFFSTLLWSIQMYVISKKSP